MLIGTLINATRMSFLFCRPKLRLRSSAERRSKPRWRTDEQIAPNVIDQSRAAIDGCDAFTLFRCQSISEPAVLPKHRDNLISRKWDAQKKINSFFSPPRKSSVLLSD